MIGRVGTGKSFKGCISYDLEDKLELSHEQKLELSAADNLQHLNRAEVLYYNDCFGNKKEICEQMRDVAVLSRRCEKPVMHFSLSLSPGEKITREQLIELGQAVIEKFGLKDRQYIIVEHKDTNHQHIHIVANRVGTDGRAVSDSNSYKKMADFCREMEKKFELKQVLSPKKFLSQELRKVPRHDLRKEQLKKDIKQCLNLSKNLEEFTGRMEEKKYQVIKGRGIAFKDEKKVYTKGSEVGYSLKAIEQKLELKQKLEQKYQHWQENKIQQYRENLRERAQMQRLFPNRFVSGPESPDTLIKEVGKSLAQTIEKLMQPELSHEPLISEFEQKLKQEEKKRKRQMMQQSISR